MVLAATTHATCGSVIISSDDELVEELDGILGALHLNLWPIHLRTNGVWVQCSLTSRDTMGSQLISTVAGPGPKRSKSLAHPPHQVATRPRQHPRKGPAVESVVRLAPRIDPQVLARTGWLGSNNIGTVALWLA